MNDVPDFLFLWLSKDVGDIVSVAGVPNVLQCVASVAGLVGPHEPRAMTVDKPHEAERDGDAEVQEAQKAWHVPKNEQHYALL